MIISIQKVENEKKSNASMKKRGGEEYIFDSIFLKGHVIFARSLNILNVFDKVPNANLFLLRYNCSPFRQILDRYLFFMIWR